MPAGRKSVPTNIHVLNGTDRPCRRNEDEPDPGLLESVPPVPEILESETAADVWNENAGKFYSSGVLTSSDIDAFTVLSQITAMWIDAVKEFNRKPVFTVEGGMGTEKQNPLINTINTLSAMSLKYFTEFGMTPSSRTKIKVSGLSKKKNKFSSNLLQANS